MRVAELMRTDVKTVDVDAMVGDAVITLADAHVSALPVTDARGRVLGVISTTDILNTLAESTDAERRVRSLDDTRVREIMTPRPRVVEPDADILDAARQMLYGEVHRLFVEQDGRLVGVISQTDIVAAVATAKI